MGDAAAQVHPHLHEPNSEAGHPRGRHLAVTASVPKGTQLLAELPFAYSVSKAQEDRVCHTCLTAAVVELKKCGGCSVLRYCSVACQKMDWKAGHREECAVLQKRPGATQTIRLALRTLLRLENERKRGSNADLQLFRSLISHQAELSAETRETFAQMAKLTYDCLRLVTFKDSDKGKIAPDVPSKQPQSKPTEVADGAAAAAAADVVDENDDERIKWVRELGIDSVQAMIEMFAKFGCNSFNILNEDLQPLGAGLYLKASALNHSCDPNAVIVFDGPRLLLRTVKDLNMGDEVCISYVDVANTTAGRKKELHERYFFECTCPMCNPAEKCSFFDRDVHLQAVRPPESTSPTINFPEMLKSVNENLERGNQHRKQRDFSSARQRYEDGLRIHNGVAGPFNLQLLELLNGLLQCCVEAQDFESALRYCEQSLPLYEFVYEGYHPMLGLQYHTAGKLAWFLEQPTKALDWLTRAFDIYRVTHGSNHSHLQPLGLLLHTVKRYQTQARQLED